MNRVATIVPVLGIGLRFSSVTKIDERESNVNSTISSYAIERSFKKIGISKRINFND